MPAIEFSLKRRRSSDDEPVSKRTRSNDTNQTSEIQTAGEQPADEEAADEEAADGEVFYVDDEGFDIRGPEKLRVLLAATTKTQIIPRFLFRGFSNSQSDPSGGRIGLNTDTAIMPAAYYPDGKLQPHDTSILDQGVQNFMDMALSHLAWERDGPLRPTQFSSWSQSLSIAFRFASGQEGASKKERQQINQTGRIAILDTHNLPRKNFITHVPKLDDALGYDGMFDEYPFEYHIHGVVDGPGLKVIPFTEFCSAGFLGNMEKWYKPPGLLKNPVPEEKKFTQALAVAKKYGGEFTAPMCLAIYCSKYNYRYYGEREDTDEERLKALEAVVDALDREKVSIPASWSLDAAIMEPGAVFTERKVYDDANWMTIGMRMLTSRRWRLE